MNIKKATTQSLLKKLKQLKHDKSKSYRVGHIQNQLNKRVNKMKELKTWQSHQIV